MRSAAELRQQLHDVNGGLLAVDLATLSDEQMHQHVVELQTLRAQLTVVTADAQHHWEQRGSWRDDGSLTASMALGRDTHACRRGSAAELRRAQRLQDMVHTRAAVLAGRLSLDHLDLFLRYATNKRWPMFLEHERVLVAHCERFTTFDQAQRFIAYWAQRVDDLLDEPHDPPAPSTLYASRIGSTGEGVLRGYLSPIDAEIVANELARLADQIRHADRANGITRTPAQRRAAALVEMARRSTSANGPTTRPLFAVIVGDDTARHLCELGSGYVVHPYDLAPYLDDASFETFLFDGPTTIISKTQRRTFTGALRHAIAVRDRHCQHAAGCDHRAAGADIDHIVPWSQGGETSQWNGRVVCKPHNRHTHLRDQPHPQPTPEHPLSRLDELRALARWRRMHVQPEGGSADDDGASDVHHAG